MSTEKETLEEARLYMENETRRIAALTAAAESRKVTGISTSTNIFFNIQESGFPPRDTALPTMFRINFRTAVPLIQTFTVNGETHHKAIEAMLALIQSAGIVKGLCFVECLGIESCRCEVTSCKTHEAYEKMKRESEAKATD